MAFDESKGVNFGRERRIKTPDVLDAQSPKNRRAATARRFSDCREEGRAQLEAGNEF